MLNVGDKIIVVLSSLKGRGTKIKRGSLGYISSIGRTYRLGKGTKRILVTPTKIIFTRYGKEKKSRCETKFVAIITTFTPYMDTTISIAVKRNYLKNIIELSKDSKKKIIEFFNKEGVIVKNIPCIIISTENSHKNMLYEKNEFMTWSTSVLKHIRLNLTYLNNQDPKNKTLQFLRGDTEIIRDIIDSATLKNNKKLNMLLTNLFKNNKKACDDLVFKLKTYTSIEKRKAIRNMVISTNMNVNMNVKRTELWRTFLEFPNTDIKQLKQTFNGQLDDNILSYNSNGIVNWIKIVRDMGKEI